MQYRNAVAVLALLALGGCTERGPTKAARLSLTEALSQGPVQALPQFPEMADSLPEIPIAAADRPTSPELSDTALVDAIARSGGKVIIGFKPASASRTRETGVIPGISRATALAARATVQALGASIIRSYRYSGAVAAVVPPALGPALRQLPVVDYVEPDFAGRVMAQDTSWGAWKVRAPFVWSGVFGSSTRGEGVWLTMLDVGVDSVHRWYGDGPANMYLDCYWIDSTGTSCYSAPGDGHGALVAGVMAALDNTIGSIGIANNPQGFASIKVCANDSTCAVSWIASGLDWALSQSSQRPRQIVSISLGWCTNDPTISGLISSLANAGILVVADAGNYSTGENLTQACGANRNDLGSDWPTGVYYPARYSQVMAVSGTLEDDAFAFAPPNPGPNPPSEGGDCSSGRYECGVPDWCYIGSRYGSQVSIAAPFLVDSGLWANGSYTHACGTSVSAPYVSGVAALVWSHNQGWTAAQVRQQLQSTAVPYSPANEYGSGRVDAVSAVYPPPQPPPVITVSITGPSLVPARRYCTWSAGAWGGTEPYSYKWTINGVGAGNGTDTLSITTPASNFAMTVTAIDANGYSGIVGDSVRVGGRQCLQQ
jgi:hypothetical protein